MPTTQLQLRRGNTAQTAIFTGAVGEVTVDTDKKTLIVHDGVTSGGTEIALKSRVDASYSKANTVASDLSTANTWLQSYVNTQVTNLIDSAPGTLDTLNELAAALGDDANFATSITNTIGVAGGYANSAYTKANTADQRAVTSGDYANSAYAWANTVYSSYAYPANAHVLSAYPHANAAFDKANTATTNAATSDQRAVTSGSYANSAYTQANTADQKAVSAGSYANSAYTQANTAITYSTSAGSYANSSYNQANTASVDAISAGSYANSAYTHANSAYGKANSVSQLINGTATLRLAANGVVYLPETGAGALYNNTASFITTTSGQTLDSYETAVFRTSKYLIQALSDADVHSSEVMVTHNDFNAYMTEYGIVKSGSDLFTLSATVSSGILSVTVTPAIGNVKIDFIRTSLCERQLIDIAGDMMAEFGTVDIMTSSGTEDLNA